MHQQLAQTLRGLAATIGPGGRLPTEHELAAAYRVSRTTVRRAIQELANEGLVLRHQGRGTFVASQRLTHPLDRLRPFVSVFTASGVWPVGKILDYSWVTEAQLPAGLPPMPDGALRARRLYLLGEIPQAVSDIFVPAPFGQQISRADIEEHPVYQVLGSRLALTLARATITLRGVPAPEDLAEALGMERAAPLLVMARGTYDNHDRLVEAGLFYLPATKFELQLNVSANAVQPLAYSFSNPGAELVLISGEGQGNETDRATSRVPEWRSARENRT